MTVALGFSSIIEEVTSYKISLSDFDGEAWLEATPYLVDNQTGVVTNLMEDTYNFTSDKGEYNDRFDSCFPRQITSNSRMHLASSIAMYPNPASDVVTIASPTAAITLGRGKRHKRKIDTQQSSSKPKCNNNKCCLT